MRLYDPCLRVARHDHAIRQGPAVLLLRETRHDRGAIEEGSNQRQLQARNCLYQCIHEMFFNVQKALRNACQRSIGLMNFSNSTLVIFNYHQIYQSRFRQGTP